MKIDEGGFERLNLKLELRFSKRIKELKRKEKKNGSERRKNDK